MNLKQRFHYPISVDSVIFGYREGKLKVALIKRKKPPFLGKWAIPGGFMEGDETVVETALRELHEETGIQDVYLEQFGVYSMRGRDPRGPTITIALFALIKSENVTLIATEDAEAAQWWDLDGVPELAYDHNEIYADALSALRLAFTIRPVAFELLPKEFTLNEFQILYEQVFNVKVDNRNFRKKIRKFSFICPTAKKTAGVKHRPALLYKFSLAEYKKYQKERLF